MKLDEFVKSPDFLKMEIIGKNKGSMDYTYNKGHTGVLCRVLDNEKKGSPHFFEVYEYFRLYLMYFAFEAQKEVRDIIQMKILTEAKSDIVHLSENLKILIQNEEFRDAYRLDGYANQCDVLIDMAQAELQAKLLESQVETNKSTIETNAISKVTNTYIAVFTAFAGGWYLYDVLYRISGEKTIMAHLPESVASHYNNLRFIPCLALTIATCFCINARLKQHPNTKTKRISNKIRKTIFTRKLRHPILGAGFI